MMNRIGDMDGIGMMACLAVCAVAPIAIKITSNPFSPLVHSSCSVALAGAAIGVVFQCWHHSFQQQH